jgi:hypothetical protein
MFIVTILTVTSDSVALVGFCANHKLIFDVVKMRLSDEPSHPILNEKVVGIV